MAERIPELEVWLRLEPVPTDEGLKHSVSLHGTEPPADGMMRYKVRISPTWVELPDGRSALTYAAAIDPVRSRGSEAPEAFRSARRHSPEALAAADAVRNASSEDRYERLLDLIEVLAP